MKVRVIQVFRDKTTAVEPKDQIVREVGEIIECNDVLALERVKGGFVEVVKDEKKPKKKK